MYPAPTTVLVLDRQLVRTGLPVAAAVLTGLALIVGGLLVLRTARLARRANVARLARIARIAPTSPRSS